MTQQSSNPYHEWHEILTDARFALSGDAITKYLFLCRGLESPAPYHIWSFISLVAALCGDNVGVKLGPLGRERVNLGIVLSGSPAIRKSTAMSVMQRFAEGLPISYGPTDTGGQRQGIMSAMMPRWQRDYDEVNPTELNPITLEELAMMNTDDIVPKLPDPSQRRSSEVYFVAKELGRLIASNNRELFDFFTDGMDGETFHYQLKNQVIRIEKPLMNILGATTPTSLGAMLPKGGESHGFLSRLIFVHAPTLERISPIPPAWGDHEYGIRGVLHDKLRESLAIGPFDFTLSAAAAETYQDLYAYVPAISDLRLQAYTGRRALHLAKVATILAFLRDAHSAKVIASDMRLAHAILVMTERTMDRAFYGIDMSQYAKVLCAVTELAENSEHQAVSVEEIQTHAGYLGNKTQLNEILSSLSYQGKLVDQARFGFKDRWGISREQWEMGTSRLRMAFMFGHEGAQGIPGPDEFRTHKVGVMGEVNGTKAKTQN